MKCIGIHINSGTLASRSEIRDVIYVLNCIHPMRIETKRIVFFHIQKLSRINLYFKELLISIAPNRNLTDTANAMLVLLCYRSTNISENRLQSAFHALEIFFKSFNRPKTKSYKVARSIHVKFSNKIQTQISYALGEFY